MKTKKTLTTVGIIVVAVLIIGGILCYGLRYSPSSSSPVTKENVISASGTSPAQSKIGVPPAQGSTQEPSSAALPDLFLNYDIMFNGGTSTSTAKSDLYYRLKNTYIKNKVTGTTTPLLSPSVYSNWHGLLYSAEVMGNTLYAGIQIFAPESDQITGVDLWKSTNNSQPTSLYKNIRIFAASGDGYVAATDGTGRNVIILNPRGYVIKTINLSPVGFCSNPDYGEGIGLINWSGHDLWLACDYTDDSPAATYLEINADTFQITKNSQPPSELGI